LFPPRPQEEAATAGEGCYVSATVHNKRYYGVLIDQDSLKVASNLWFQDQAGSLELNRRMNLLQHQQQQTQEDSKPPSQPQQQGFANNNHKDDNTLPASSSTETPRQLSSESNGNHKRPISFADPIVIPASNSNGDNHKRAKLSENEVSSNTATATATTIPSNGDNHKRAKLGENEVSSNTATATATTMPNGFNPDPVPSSAPVSNLATVATMVGTSTASQQQQQQQQLDEFSDRPVQKFRYVPQPLAQPLHNNQPKQRNPSKVAAPADYRVLLATYANVLAAAEDDPVRAQQIQVACNQGGNFVAATCYYYQFEVLGKTLVGGPTKHGGEHGLRTSMGLHTFFHGKNLKMGEHLCTMLS
jgi:hypothetical protein